MQKTHTSILTNKVLASSFGQTKKEINHFFLTELHQVIKDNIEEVNFDVPKLARHLNISVSQLNRKLNFLLNKSAGQLIREKRLVYAAQQLLTNTISIAAIANRIGYRHQAHFTRSFKQYFGCSPTVYIKRNYRKGKFL